jgi:hypothetical protein
MAPRFYTYQYQSINLKYITAVKKFNNSIKFFMTRRTYDSLYSNFKGSFHDFGSKGIMLTYPDSDTADEEFKKITGNQE